MTRALILGLLLGGCAYTSGTTEVAPLGGDMYQVGGSAGQYVGGQTQASTLALQKANAFCAGQGRQMQAVGVMPVGGQSQITFRCLDANDPTLAKPFVPPSQTTTMNVNVNTGR